MAVELSRPRTPKLEPSSEFVPRSKGMGLKRGVEGTEDAWS